MFIPESCQSKNSLWAFSKTACGNIAGPALKLNTRDMLVPENFKHIILAKTLNLRMIFIV
jgi:hypothetical protein